MTLKQTRLCSHKPHQITSYQVCKASQTLAYHLPLVHKHCFPLMKVKRSSICTNEKKKLI